MKFSKTDKITYFKEEQIQNIELPQKFTFPFYYQPHLLTEIAANELQTYLENEFSENHNFGLEENKEGLIIGKMFGVLVVQDSDNKIGYLSAFSGKLANSNNHEKFVPPVFDMLVENSFFLNQEEILNAINREIETLETHPEFIQAKKDLAKFSTESQTEISNFKTWMKERKALRKSKRENNSSENFEQELIRESNLDQFKFRMLKESWNDFLNSFQSFVSQFETKIDQLKKERKEKSASLQNQLFKQYTFLNQARKTKDLQAIFSETIYETPPAGAGECATPKLLQYAFRHDLKPLAMAEFWWGASPKSEVRKHKQFYPACNGKCRPILKHMLEGMEIDENPLLQNLAAEKQLKVIYEDESFIIVDKPAELLSVPGIEIQDSVYTRLQTIIEPIEPLIIHRLDMSTSGILVVAKTKQAHKNIQQQFIKHTVEKRYSALLDGKISNHEGIIDLPLRGDFDDRPRQLVCFEHGKKTITLYKVVEQNDNTTKVHFWPKTGRTHQLRMHASHNLGLNAPIVGDDLYGKPSDRLYLHAAYLAFDHPITQERMIFESKEAF